MSQRLGYTSNVLYTWEAGLVFPTAHRAFELAVLAGADMNGGLRRFFRELPARLRDCSPNTPEGIRLLMVELRGRTPVSQLAAAMGISRFTLSRWLNGRGQPKLNEFFLYVEVSSMRILDFAAAFVDPADLPSIAEKWKALQRARRLGYDSPVIHAVLRALETTSYEAEPLPSTLKRLLQLPEEDIAYHLAGLAEAGQVQLASGRWVPAEAPNVDFRRNPVAAQRVKAFWARFAADRCQARRKGLFAYNVFSVSRADLERLEQLQRDYLREMRALIASSEPNEVVALANFQLFALED